MERFHSLGEHARKFVSIKETVNMKAITERAMRTHDLCDSGTVLY